MMKRWCPSWDVCLNGAELEVQRTIKRAELTAFLCLLKRVVGPIKVHVGNKGIIDGSRKGENKCIKPRAGDADLWIQIWEELHGLAERGILVEVEHVKAHRTKKEKTNMSQFERFVTEGNVKVNELAKGGALLDEGFTEDVYAALQYAASLHCLGRTVKGSNPSRKKSEFSWLRRVRKRNIEQSGVRKQTSIDA